MNVLNTKGGAALFRGTFLNIGCKIPVLARPDATGVYEAHLVLLLAAKLFSLVFGVNNLRICLEIDQSVLEGEERKFT